jgi:hypothetical protein
VRIRAGQHSARINHSTKSDTAGVIRQDQYAYIRLQSLGDPLHDPPQHPVWITSQFVAHLINRHYQVQLAPARVSIISYGHYAAPMYYSLGFQG